MSQISLVTNEFIYKFKLVYRKSLPTNPGFYIILFFTKFIPVILFTHSIEPNSLENPSLFSLSRILKSLVIWNKSFEFNYVMVCGVLYAIVIFIFASIIFVFTRYYKASKNTDFVLYKIPTNKLYISKATKRLYRFTIFLFLCLIFCYQHVLEIFFYGIFKVYARYLGEENLDSANRPMLQYQGEIIIFIVNIIFIAGMIFMMYFFITLTTSQTIFTTYGYQASVSQINIITNIFGFSLQGVYSTSFFFSAAYRKKYLMVFIYLLICVLLVNLINGLKQINYLSSSKVEVFMRFMNNFCLTSGVVEVLIYHLTPSGQKGDQRYYFLKLLFDIINGIIITWFISTIQKKLSLQKLANIFFFTNKAFEMESLFEFYLDMKNLKDEKTKYMYILKLLQVHQQQCNLETCRCHRYKKYFIVLNDKDNVANIVNKFITLGENKITDAIINHSNLKNESISQLLFIHCDFLFSIKNNIPITLYLCQYYLIKRRNELSFNYAYLIYEINTLIKEKINDMNKDGKNVVDFLKQNLIFEKIQTVIKILCSNIEKLLYYKNLKNTNSKLLFTCEDILYPLIEFVDKSKKLKKLVTFYAAKNTFDHSIELKYVIHYYIKLFNVSFQSKVEHKIFNGKNLFPTYDEIYSDNSDKNNLLTNYIIIFLNCENKFIIRYISTEITETLSYNRLEIIGNDFNEMMVPKSIVNFHTIYMKQFILLGNSVYAKKTYLLNKENQLIPVSIGCKILPTTNTLYSMIINIDPVESSDFNHYYVLLDTQFHLWAISNSFEQEFYFSLKMLNYLKINFCDFFGVNKDKINDYFIEVKTDATNATNKMNNKKMNLMALPSVKNDELYYYQNIDENYFKSGNSNISNKNKDNTKFVKLDIVGKDKIVNSISKILKNIEELGLEKEWKFKLTELYNKLKSKALCQTQNVNNAKKDSAMNMSNFFFKFQFKQIGNIQYYAVTISELIDEAAHHFMDIITNNDEIETIDNQDNELMGLKNNYKKGVTNQSLVGRDNEAFLKGQINNNINNNPNSKIITLMNSTNNNSLLINTSKDNSQVSLINNDSSNLGPQNLNTKNPKQKEVKQGIFNKFTDNFNVNQSSDTFMSNLLALEKKTNQVNILKILEGFFLVVVLVLNIVNFVQNSSSITFSLNLFYLNAYSFLFANDIFYGSMAAINACLIRDGIQTGNITDLNTKITQSADDLMMHYHLFNSYTNKMLSKSEIAEIYTIFHSQETYYYILPNWVQKQHESTLLEEIYSVHYYLNTFDIKDTTVTENNNCRLQKLFFNQNYLNFAGTELTDYQATNEETFVYYIIYNLVTNISLRLENLMKTTNLILNKDNNSSKISSIAFNTSILISAGLLYILIIFTVQTSRNIFKGRMIYLFTQHDNEELFFEDIQKFKKLIEAFDKKECNNYTNFKMGVCCSSGNQYSSEATNKFLLGFSTYKQGTTSAKPAIAKEVPPLIDPPSSGKRSVSSKHKLKSSAKASGKTKEEIAEAAEILANKIESTNKSFQSKAEPFYAFCSLIVLCATFVIFFGVELANIFTSSTSYDGLMVENEFVTNFLSRAPKINELILYSIITVILDNLMYITKDVSVYADNVLSNYYKIELDIQSNSLFKTLASTNYAYLYYQLYIIRNNLSRFINDASMNSYLQDTTKKEFLFNQDENFCVYSTYEYIKHYYGDIKNDDEFLSTLSSEVKTCRTIGNGINLKGYQAGLDLMLQQLTNLYYNFDYEDKSTRQMAFLKNEDILVIENNLLNAIRTLHFADSYLVVDDINNSYSESHTTKVIFSIISICFSCGVILGMLIVIVIKLDSFNDVIAEIFQMFEKSIRNYS